MKRYIQNSSTTKSEVYVMKDKLEIEIELPLDYLIYSSLNDIVNKQERKTMDMLREDVAAILKNEFGFKILKEVDKTRKDAHGNFVETEGHVSDNKDSLSLYYYVRYDICQSDELIKDGNKLSDIQAIVYCDLVLRITDHIFNENGLAAQRTYDKNKLNELAEQEGSEPDYKDLTRQQLEISDEVRHNYSQGLNEVRYQVKDAILAWRTRVKSKFLTKRGRLWW